MCFTDTWLHEDILTTTPPSPALRQYGQTEPEGKAVRRKEVGLLLSLKTDGVFRGILLSRRESAARTFWGGGLHLIAVYVPPSDDITTACDIIHLVTAKLHSQQPSTFFMISGDFKHVSLFSTMTNFTQFDDCPNRDNKSLDLLYVNIKDTYSSIGLPPHHLADQITTWSTSHPSISL